jgi:Flp pilus assembly protein TadD
METRRQVMRASRGFGLALLVLALAACPKKQATPPPATPKGPSVATPGRPTSPTGPIQPAGPSAAPATPEQAALEAFARGLQLVDADPKLAIDAFREAVQSNPKMHVAFYNLGVLQERVGDDNAADKNYSDCLAIAADYAPAVGNLTNLLIRRGDLRRAVRLTADLGARFPARLDLRAYFVKALVADGEYDKALREAKAILREDEKNVGAMVALSAIYYSQRKFELAAHAMRLALKIDPENPDVHHRLGHALLAQGEKKAAKESFQKAVELKRDFPEALNSLAMLLLEEGDTGRALNYLEDAVRLSPSFVAARMNLGNAYRKSGDVARAKAEYERVLALRPRFADAIYNLALLYLDHPMPDAPDEVKRLEVALGYFGQYRDAKGRLAPSDPATRYFTEASRKIVQLRKAEEKRRERERLKTLKKEMEGTKVNLGGK